MESGSLPAPLQWRPPVMQPGLARLQVAAVLFTRLLCSRLGSQLYKGRGLRRSLRCDGRCAMDALLCHDSRVPWRGCSASGMKITVKLPASPRFFFSLPTVIANCRDHRRRQDRWVLVLKSCAQGIVILVSLDRSSNPKSGGTPPPSMPSSCG